MPEAPSGSLAVAVAAVAALERLLAAVAVVERTHQSPQSASLPGQRYTYQSAQVAQVAYPAQIRAALAATLGLTRPPIQPQPLILTAHLQKAALAHHQQLAALVGLPPPE